VSLRDVAEEVLSPLVLGVVEDRRPTCSTITRDTPRGYISRESHLVGDNEHRHAGLCEAPS